MPTKQVEPVLKQSKLEDVRISMDKFRDRKIAQASGQTSESTQISSTVNDWKKLREMQTLNTSYLLISPPLSFIIGLATMLTPLVFDTAIQSVADSSTMTPKSVEDRLSQNYSFAVWGRQDGLQGSQHLRKWASRLGSRTPRRFQSHEVPLAGHFWHEEGVEFELSSSIRNWLESLDRVSHTAS